MKTTELCPLLRTYEITEQIYLYTEILNFEVGKRNDESNWASPERNEIGPMIAKPNSDAEFMRRI